VGTSARLETALRLGAPIPADWVSVVIVKRGDRTSWHLVDSEAISAAELDPAASPFVLRDRDQELRVLNDRLLMMSDMASWLHRSPQIRHEGL
jgi:hypothetical protein